MKNLYTLNWIISLTMVFAMGFGLGTGNPETPSFLELLQKPQVVFKKQTNIRDAVLSHSKPFYAETESPAGVLLAVYPDRIENVRVNHSAATHLYPAFLPSLINPE